MSFDKIEFVKPLDILQGGFNPNLPAEISVTEQLLYSIANNLAILNNNLINSGALQNLALMGDLMQEIFTDDRIQDKKSSVFKTSDNATIAQNQSAFIGSINAGNQGVMNNIGLANVLRFDGDVERNFWNNKNTAAIVNQASSTYSFNVPVPSVNVSSSPATVNVNASAPVVNNNIPVPHVTNNVEVAPAVPEITVNATAPIVNNNIDVPSVTNEISVQSAVPNIEVSSTAPIVNVSSSPATVNVSSTAPIVNNNIPVPSVNVSSSPATVNVSSAPAAVNVSSTAPVVNVAPMTDISDAHFDYDDTNLIAKIEQMRELLENALNADVDSDKIGLANVLYDSLTADVESDSKMGLADIILNRDNVNLIDYPVEMLTEPATTKKLRSF